MMRIMYDTGMTELPPNCLECKMVGCNLPMCVTRSTVTDRVKKAYTKKRHPECPLTEVVDYSAKNPESKYTPTCPRGYTDCVCDPAYIRYHHKPDMTDEEFNEALEECREAVRKDPNMQYFCYDDEDK